MWDVENKRLGLAKATSNPPEEDMHLWQESGGPTVHASIRGRELENAYFQESRRRSILDHHANAIAARAKSHNWHQQLPQGSHEKAKGAGY